MVPEKGGDFLQWLRGFYYTAKERSVSRASGIMGRGQPTITQHIQSLERDLGVILFDRSKRRMQLTDEGQNVLDHTIDIFESIKALHASIAKNEDQPTGEVRIVSTHAVLVNFLPRFLLAYKKKYPLPIFRLDSGSFEHIIHSIQKADADLGIACPLETPENIDCEPIFQTSPVVISAKHSPWRLNRESTLSEVAKLPYITYPASSSITMFVKKHFQMKGLVPNVVFELNHFQHIKRYVELGFGISIMDEYTLEDHDYEYLDVYHLNELDVKRVYSLITRQNCYLSLAARAFKKLLQKPPDQELSNCGK